ncbi:MAG: pyruvate kinase [Planctomycetota bacterium]
MDTQPRPVRHTKIVATIGPATESREKLTGLIRMGVDVIRLNMAHGSVEWVAEVVARIREVSRELGRHVAVMMDVKGPEIRTGPVEADIELKPGDRVCLQCTSGTPVLEADHRVSVNYRDLPNDVAVGSTVLVDSGLLRWQVVEKSDCEVLCEVVIAGKLGSRRHINLPGVFVNLPALTEKDKRDLAAGVKAGIDFVALSFVRRGEDIEVLRAMLSEMNHGARIIAKIEDQSGASNMLSIIRAADGVMVARGDLGIEIEYSRLPLVQTELVRACRREGKPVIIATHLLESMVDSPLPTRAEISDVATAVREQADAVMLSGETTTGSYPLESVDALLKIINSIEPSVEAPLNTEIDLHEPKAKMLRAAAVLTQDLDHSGIVVFTRSGFLAYVLGALRPRGIPIFAFTDVEQTFRQCLLPWGVEPFLMPFDDANPEQTIQDALQTLCERQWCRRGQWMAVITNVLAGDTIIDSMQLRQVT